MIDDAGLAFMKKHLDFWEKLSAEDAAALAAGASVKRFTKGTSLRSGDDECLGLLLVREGELRAYIQSDDGREVTLYDLGPGELCVLSASCILNSIDFDVLIGAVEDTEAIKIGIPAFEAVMKRNVWVENFAYKSAVERFSDVMWAIEQILFMRFDKRLAIALLDESKGSVDGEVRKTHEEIAKQVGSAREVVSRMLKSFESRSLVSLGRGSLRVLDREALKRML